MPPRATLFGDHSRALVIYYPPKLKTPPGWPVNKFWAPYRLAPTLDLRSRFFFLPLFCMPHDKSIGSKKTPPYSNLDQSIGICPNNQAAPQVAAKKKKIWKTSPSRTMCVILYSSTIANALLRLDFILHSIMTYLAISLENWQDKIIIHNNFCMPSNQCDPLKCISSKL